MDNTENPKGEPSSEAKAATKSKSKQNAKPQTFWQQVRENVVTIAIALGLALLLRVFVAEPRYIPSDSMVPTLKVGDRLIVEKISYRFHPPEPGDIVVFRPPPALQDRGYRESQAFIKRAIAAPGETIAVLGGRVYIDREPLEEDYIAEAPAYQMPPATVPPASLFVMGDNRNNSNDSHVWGFLPEKQTIGRACFRFWPLDRAGWLRSPKRSLVEFPRK